MKKFLMMFLALATVVGCSSNAAEGESSKNDETEQPKEQVELKIWLDDDNYAKALSEAVSEALPHITLKYEKVAPIDTGAKIELDGPAGIGADIFLQPHDAMAKSIESQVLLPLGDELGNLMNEVMLPGAVETASKDGGYYGMPLSVETMALFYNKTLLDESGLELATSFEQIKEQAATFNNVSENKFLLRFIPGNAYNTHFFLSSAGWELYGDTLDITNLNLTSNEAIQGLENMLSYREFLDVPASDLNNDTVNGEFEKGTVPYIITGPWVIKSLKENADFEWGVTKIPTINGVQPTTFSGNIIACLSAYSEHPDEAREVLEFMASSEGLQILFETTGRIPATKDVNYVEGVSEDPYVTGVLEQAAFATGMPLVPEIKTYWGPAKNMLTAVWDGILSPVEAAEAAQEEYQLLLEMSESN